jgi:hypothetical protein
VNTAAPAPALVSLPNVDPEIVPHVTGNAAPQDRGGGAVGDVAEVAPGAEVEVEAEVMIGGRGADRGLDLGLGVGIVRLVPFGGTIILSMAE